MSLSMVFGLLGGLGMFIYGMRQMSEGLQKVAGRKLKNLLGMLTSNRFAGVFVGIIVTAIIQSSSATTVMVVGFV
ncbi:MAG TPA: Na/Pi symporter, partial [Halanaerobiales bacterium]|nr:Na/Pi symporter [Halanaerobiales bacterium]